MPDEQPNPEQGSPASPQLPRDGSGPLVYLHACNTEVEAEILAQRLKSAGVEPLVEPWVGHPGRAANYLDVLVRPGDLPRASQVLQSCGIAVPQYDPALPPVKPARRFVRPTDLLPGRVSLWLIVVAVGFLVGFWERLVAWFGW